MPRALADARGPFVNVGGVKCSDKCLTIIRIIAILFKYPEVKVNMIDGNIKALTSIL